MRTWWWRSVDATEENICKPEKLWTAVIRLYSQKTVATDPSHSDETQTNVHRHFTVDVQCGTETDAAVIEGT